MRKLSLLLILVLLALFLAACGEADVNKIENNNSNNASSNESSTEVNNGNDDEGEVEEEETPEELRLSVGDSVEFDGLIITLNEARIEPGGDFDTPDEDQFVVVNLTAENTTDEEQVVSSLMNVELRDNDGYSYNTTILIEGTKGQFDGSIEPGGKLRGEIPFDVPESDVYELHFSNPFKKGKAIWIITADDLNE